MKFYRKKIAKLTKFTATLSLTVAALACSGSKYLKPVDLEVLPKDHEFQRPEQVTAGNESNFSPELSQNGVFVIYTSDRKGNKDIWEKRASGGFARPLTLHAADDFSAVISPNGKKIAFVSRREDATGDIHILTTGFNIGAWWNREKEGALAVIKLKQTEDTSPAWFPDGERLVFAARAPGDQLPVLMLAHLDDLKATPLGDIRGEQPAVSPDGRFVAYSNAGSLFVYDVTADKKIKLTEGGAIQDGQPRFTQDGKSLVFIRYCDDTNLDGKLDGDDHPSIWQVEITAQNQSHAKDNYLLTPLTAANFAAFSPQIRVPFLYFTLQQTDSLDIFRLPQTGQIAPAMNFGDLDRQVTALSDHYEKVLALRRAAVAFYAAKDVDSAAEAGLRELNLQVQAGRRVEAELVAKKIRANFAADTQRLALVDLAMIELDLSPLRYPEHKRDLSPVEQEFLSLLLGRLERLLSADSPKTTVSARVIGAGLLTKAKILAAQRAFFAANDLLAAIKKDHADQKTLMAFVDYQAALIASATSDVDTAVRDLKQVVKDYVNQPEIVALAAKAAVALLEDLDNAEKPSVEAASAAEPTSRKLEALVALKTEARGLPVMPALAHMRIVEHYAAAGKEAVVANELRQLLDSNPESPAVMLQAAERLTKLEEKNGRYTQAEAMLVNLNKRFMAQKTDFKKKAQDLLIDFHLRRAETLLRDREAALAIKEYRKVIELADFNVSAHRGTIDAAFQRGPEALLEITKQYREMVQKNPQRADASYFYGYALTYQIDLEKTVGARLQAADAAITVVEEARQRDSQILQIHQTLGWLYLQKAYWQEKNRQTGGFEKFNQKKIMLQNFFGFGDPNWLELSIDSFLTAYYLSREDSIERAGLTQNLGQAYYDLKNYQKSLNYYLQRIKMLPLVPQRTVKAEGVLWRRAGRAAFQAEAMDLAESLQKQALKVWESLNSDLDVAYSLDALALTLRERSKYQEAVDLYERLLTIQRRLRSDENTVAALTNLGYCTFTLGQHARALTYFDAAEELLSSTGQAVKSSQEDAESVDSDTVTQVNLAGAGSAAKGFDGFARKNLIMSFRSQIYENSGRFDLAIKSHEARLLLLQQRRDALVADDESPKSLAEDIALVQNRIGELRLAQGDQIRARLAFQAAATIAKTLRPEGQEYMSQAEWVNAINYGRVQLRMATLGLLPDDELVATINELESAAAALRPVYKAGSKSEAKPLAELLSLTASLSRLRQHVDQQDKSVTDLKEALAIADKSGLDLRTRYAALLTAAAAPHERGPTSRALKADKTLAQFLAELQAVVDPDIEWRQWAQRAEFHKAFEGLERFILAGGTFTAPTDRLKARQIFEAVLEQAVAQAPHEPKKIALLLRRYQLLRQTELARRSLGRWNDSRKALILSSDLEKLLTLRDDEDFHDVLTADGQNNALLLLHRTLNGTVWAVLQTDKSIQVASAVIADNEIFSAPAYAALLAQLMWENLGYGYLYLVPSAELYAVDWEQVPLQDKKLQDFAPLAYLASADHLPALYAKRSLPKNRLGYIAWPRPHTGFSSLSQRGQIDAEAIAPEEGTNIGAAFKNYDIVHSEAPFKLNDIEPKQSVLTAGAAQVGTTASSSRFLANDLSLTQLAALELPSTQLISLARLEIDRKNLGTPTASNDQGYDGWALLSMAAASAQVPSLLLDRGDGALQAEHPFDPREKAKDWLKFFRDLSQQSIAEVLQKTRLPVRVIGYGGVPRAAEGSLVHSKFDETLEAAEEAFDDGEFDEAAVGFRAAHYFAQRLKDKDKEYAVLDRLVQALFSKRDYAVGLHYKKKMAELMAAKLKAKVIEPFDYGEVVMDAAVLAVRGQNFTVAETLLKRSEAIFAAEAEEALLGKVYHYRAINFENQKKYRETIAAFEKSRNYFLKSDAVQAASRLLDIGNIYRNNLSDYSAALDFYGQAADEFKKIGNQELHVPVLIDKANTLMTIGQLEATINLLEREVLPQIAVEKSRNLWIRATQVLANAYFRVGLYQEARERNEQALIETEKIEQNQTKIERELDVLNLRAMINAKLGQYKEAFVGFKEAIAKAEEFQIKYQIALLYNNYGFWLREYGQVDQSLIYFDKALKIDTELKSRSSIAYDQRNLGLSVLLKGDFNRAQDLLLQALKTSEELNLTYNTVYCYFGLGDMALRNKQWDAAQKAFAKALAHSEQGFMQDFIWRARSGLGAVALALGQDTLAEKEFAKAIALVEKLRAGLKTEDSRNAFQSDRGVQELYRDEVIVLMRMGKIEQAWTVSEQARARAFVDTIGSQKIKLARLESAQLLVEEKHLKNHLDVSERRLARQRVAKSDSDGQLAAAEAAFKSAQQDYGDLVTRMRGVDSQLSSFVNVDVITLAELKQILPADMGLVQYMMTPRELFVWVIYQGRLIGKTLPVAAEAMRAQVRDFKTLMQNYSTTDYLGRELSDVLLKPIAKEIDGMKRLVIVPHDALHFLPFAALPDPQSKKDAARSVLERLTLHYLDSATMARFAAQPKSTLTHSPHKIFAVASAEDDLPFTQREIDAMKRYFPDIDARDGRDLLKADFQRAAAAADVVHIAAHGFFNAAAPGESFLQLGTDRLSVIDVFGASLKAKLVTLSACESGLGQLSAGDEIIGFNRAFLYAGADSVVSNLWRVNDVASAVVMKRFYRYLSEGEDKASALRHAQLVTRRYFKHPAYWSAFRLTGDYR